MPQNAQSRHFNTNMCRRGRDSACTTGAFSLRHPRTTVTTSRSIWKHTHLSGPISCSCEWVTELFPLQTAEKGCTQTTASDVTFNYKWEGSTPTVMLPNRIRQLYVETCWKVCKLKLCSGVSHVSTCHWNKISSGVISNLYIKSLQALWKNIIKAASNFKSAGCLSKKE